MLPAKVLARSMPIHKDWLNFDWSYHLDSSFKDAVPAGREVVSIDPETSMPHQYGRVHYKKNGEKWSIGFNIAREGEDLWFQTFYWLGDLPAKKMLNKDDRKGKNKKFQVFGERQRFDRTSRHQISESSAQIAEYPQLKAVCASIFPSFKIKAQDTEAQADPSQAKADFAGTVVLDNTGSKSETKLSTNVSHAWTSSATATHTETHNVQVGLNYSYSLTSKISTEILGIGGSLESQFTMGMNLSCGESETVTATGEDATTLALDTVVEATVPAGGAKYVTTVEFSDDHATASFNVDAVLKGELNGQPLSGRYLEELLLAMPGAKTTILGKDDLSVTYRSEGSVKAGLVVRAAVYVTDEEPEDVGCLIKEGQPVDQIEAAPCST